MPRQTLSDAQKAQIVAMAREVFSTATHLAKSVAVADGLVSRWFNKKSLPSDVHCKAIADAIADEVARRVGTHTSQDAAEQPKAYVRSIVESGDNYQVVDDYRGEAQLTMRQATSAHSQVRAALVVTRLPFLSPAEQRNRVIAHRFARVDGDGLRFDFMLNARHPRCQKMSNEQLIRTVIKDCADWAHQSRSDDGGASDLLRRLDRASLKGSVSNFRIPKRRR